MQQKMFKQWMAQQTFWKRLKHPLAGLILTFGVFLAHLSSVEAQTAPIAPPPDSASAVHSASTAAGQSKFPADGIYLYGQSPQPGQLGIDYAVMEVRDRQTVGAFYRVSSSFDCFYGEVGSDQIDLTIVNSYEQVAYSYALPLDQATVVADGSSSTSAPVELVGFHPIDTLSDLDMEILSTCRAEYSQEI